MTSVTSTTAPAAPSLQRTARVTGLLYLGLGITGILGFLLVRSALFDADNPAATLAHLVEDEGLARAGIALELGVVITQALAVVWFFRLFRGVDTVAAACIAAFGLVNSVLVLVSAAFIATALQTALGEPLAPGGDDAATVQLLYVVSGNLWAVAGVFFGLWLVPMGYCVLKSGTMPRPLGWLLVVGGFGYVLGTFITFLAPEATLLIILAPMPATIGEFWMIGYLLLRGGPRPSEDPAPASALE